MGKDDEHLPGKITVDELTFGWWSQESGGGNPGWAPPVPDQPPGPLERLTAWLRAQAKPLVAALGALALVAAVAIVATGPGGGPEAAPAPTTTTVAAPTTQPRPVAVAPNTTTSVAPGSEQPDVDDYRLVLGTVPEGFEIAGASVIDPSIGFGNVPAYQLFAAPGATWSQGPWLLLASGTSDSGVQYSSAYRFTRPPTSIEVNGASAVVGPTTLGDETTIVRGDGVLVVTSLGLPASASVTVAGATTLRGGGTALAASALPPGLEPVRVDDFTLWTGGWLSTARASVFYQSATDPAGWINVVSGPADASARTTDMAAFFLDDLRYAEIDGHSAVAGTNRQDPGSPVHYVHWRTGDRQVLVTASGAATLDDAIAAAATVRTAGDDGWRDTTWTDALEAAQDCCRTTPAAEQVHVGNFDDATSTRWSVDVGRQASGVWWSISSDQDSIGTSVTAGAPALSVAGSYFYDGQTSPFSVGAFAMVDRTMAGSVLRLRTDGTAPQIVEVQLVPVEGSASFAPYLMGAAALPWTDGGFIAELVGPGGQVIASRTEIDLP
jgi:hypothetical protein